MKRNITIVFISVLLYACGMRREQSFHHSKASSRWEVENKALEYVWVQRDSNGRQWSFTGDTVFYYHPDSGLWAYGGTLSIVEAMRKSAFSHLQERRSMDYGQDQTGETIYLKRYDWYWSIGTVVLGIVLFYLYWWRRW